MVICFGRIREKDYELLRSFCVSTFVGEDYTSFLQNIIKKKQEFKDKGIVTVDVDIDAALFKQWFGERGKAGYERFFTYSAIVHDNFKK